MFFRLCYDLLRMRTPKQTFQLIAGLWVAGHVALSGPAVWAFATDNAPLAEILTYYLIAWQPLMAISLYAETRNVWSGRTDNANVALPSLAVIFGMWLVWQVTH